MDLGLFYDPDVAWLPNEMLIHIVSMSCLTMLLYLSDVNNVFTIYATFELKKRLQKLLDFTIKSNFDCKFFSIEHYPTRFEFRKLNSVKGRAKMSKYENSMDVTSAHLILKTLRLVGDQIKKIHCNFFNSTEEQANAVVSYINQYCINLECISFYNMRHDLQHSLVKPFPKVKEVHFESCILLNKFCNLNFYFPKLWLCTFSENNYIEKLSSLITTYPHLRCMEISTESMYSVTASQIQSYNPQAEIEYLDFSRYYDGPDSN